jgi:ADP-heptose:LPS heptosyltransferase
VKALLVRLSAIGDVVHTLPALAALHRHGYEAGWVVEPPARPLLEGHPFLSQVAAAPAARAFRGGAAWATLRALRQRRYDVALDFQGLWKSAAWARLSGARRVMGYARGGRREPLSALLAHERALLPTDLPHVIDKNLALLRLLGIEAVGAREFPLPPSGAEAARVEAALGASRLHDFVILNPGGGWASKLWPLESFGELARGLRERGLVPLVTFGPGEEGLATRVVSASGGAAAPSFPTTLLEFVELARRARLVVAADTGPLHIACALGTPVVGLFGPTDPARNGPFSPQDLVVRRAPACAPCHRRRCAIHDGVMRQIPPSAVLEAALRRLGRSGPESLAV